MLRKPVIGGNPEKLATEAPVNGGPNYEGPKVNLVLRSQHASLSQTELYAGNSSTAVRYSFRDGGAVTIRRTWGQSAGKAHHVHPWREPSETLRSDRSTHHGARCPMGGGLYRRRRL